MFPAAALPKSAKGESALPRLSLELPEAHALRFRLRRARFEKIQHILVLDDLLNLPHGF